MVLADEPRRGSLLQSLASELGGSYNPKGSGSSVGRVEVDGLHVFCKPTRRYPAYAYNEEAFVSFINDAVAKERGPVTVEAVDSRGRRFIRNEVCHAFRLPSNYRRMDVGLVKSDGTVTKVSIKMTNFSFWCSAWESLAAEMSRAIEGVVECSDGRNRLDSRGCTSAWFPLSQEESQFAVFGKEEAADSALFIGNFFMPNSMVLLGGRVVVFPEAVARTAKDLDSWITPIAVARNESRSHGALPGIRFEVQAARKITSGYRKVTRLT